MRLKKSLLMLSLKKKILSDIVFCLHVCMYTICVPGAQGHQKKVLGPQELE